MAMAVAMGTRTPPRIMDILRKATRRQWRRILPNMATLILNQAATHLTVTVAILLQATLQAV
jgi:hypothetical protein